MENDIIYFSDFPNLQETGTRKDNGKFDLTLLPTQELKEEFRGYIMYLCHFSFPAFYHTFTFSVETSRSIKIFYFKVSLRFSSLILLCNILALVIKLFTTCHANLYFYQAVLEINLQWYQSQSFFL